MLYKTSLVLLVRVLMISTFFLFKDVSEENFETLGIEVMIDDKKCILNNTMGQALIRLDHLGLSLADEVSDWFSLQNEKDLKCYTETSNDYE